MANTFNRDIHQLATTALAELAEAQGAGRLPRTPVSEAHFLGRWITQALKQHRFPRTTAAQLKAWQQQARSRGGGAELVALFSRIRSGYGPLLLGEAQGMAPVQEPQLMALLKGLEALGWQVETRYAVTRACHHPSEGRHSLVVCADALSNAFDEAGQLVEPLSLFVRGEVVTLVQAAYRQGLLLHKISDYRALVKYHGEYRLYPHNAGPILAELPESTA